MHFKNNKKNENRIETTSQLKTKQNKYSRKIMNEIKWMKWSKSKSLTSGGKAEKQNNKNQQQ